MKLLVATKNEGKLREIRQLLADLDVEILGIKDLPTPVEVVEDGATFTANARKKAVTLHSLVGCAVLADDSGLEVEALAGAPGVLSARYAGADAGDKANYEMLLAAMAGIQDMERGAQFRCVMVLLAPDGREWVAEGACKGRIAHGPRGGGGFGYDPVFWLPANHKTMAEMSDEEKNRISHRGRALRKMIRQIRALVGEAGDG